MAWQKKRGDDTRDYQSIGNHLSTLKFLAGCQKTKGVPQSQIGQKTKGAPHNNCGWMTLLCYAYIFEMHFDDEWISVTELKGFPIYVSVTNEITSWPDTFRFANLLSGSCSQSHS